MDSEVVTAKGALNNFFPFWFQCLVLNLALQVSWKHGFLLSTIAFWTKDFKQLFPISSSYKRPSTTSSSISPSVVAFQTRPSSSPYNRGFCSYTRERGSLKIHILAYFMQFYHRFLTLNNANRRKTDHKFFALSSLAIVVKLLANMILTVTCISHFLVQLLLTYNNLQLSWKLFVKFEGDRKTKMHAFNVSSIMCHNI